MKGIQFVQDAQKKTVAAIVDLRILQDTFDEFFSALIVKKDTKGIGFKKDEKGNIFAVEIDLKQHQLTFDEFFSELIVRSKDDDTAVDVPKNMGKDQKVATILAAARSFLGTKHKMTGDSLYGIDCSGLSFMAFKEAGIVLPRDSRAQALKGAAVPTDKLQAGDLVFFTYKKPDAKISHVGIVASNVAGKVRFIHTSTSRGVVEEDLFSKYYTDTYIIEAKRMVV